MGRVKIGAIRRDLTPQIAIDLVESVIEKIEYIPDRHHVIFMDFINEKRFVIANKEFIEEKIYMDYQVLFNIKNPKSSGTCRRVVDSLWDIYGAVYDEKFVEEYTSQYNENKDRTEVYSQIDIITKLRGEVFEALVVMKQRKFYEGSYDIYRGCTITLDRSQIVDQVKTVDIWVDEVQHFYECKINPANIDESHHDYMNKLKATIIPLIDFSKFAFVVYRNEEVFYRTMDRRGKGHIARAHDVILREDIMKCKFLDYFHIA